MSHTPKLTIGLPVYNGERYLNEAINSILNQTFTDFELLISDNASIDATAHICREFVRQDRRVTYIRQEKNLGAAPNYNLLVAPARGKYFKWAADDDLLQPTFCERCIEVLDGRPNVAVCYSQANFIDVNGAVVQEFHDRLNLDTESPSKRYKHFMQVISKAHPVFGLIRTDVLRQTPLFGSYPSSDLVLLGLLSLLGRFHEVQERLFLRRLHPDQSMQAYADMRDRSSWFDTARATGSVFPLWRLAIEHAKMVALADLPLETRLLCLTYIRHRIMRRPKQHCTEIISGTGIVARRLLHRRVELPSAANSGMS